MSDNTFGLIFFGIIMIGIIIYGIAMVIAVNALHRQREAYYKWIKQGGGQVQNLHELYTKEDLEKSCNQ